MEAYMEKKTVYLTLAIGVFILAGCTNKGFVKYSSMHNIDSDIPLIEQAKIANQGQYKIGYRSLKSNETPLIDTLPIGTIIPFWGPFVFSDQWQIAMGQVIQDPASPLFKKKVPDLNGAFSPFETSYIAGTLDSRTYNKNFGRSDIPNDGEHIPSGTVQLQHGLPHPNGWNDRSSSNHLIIPKLKMNHVLPHAHKGENRPRTYGVVFLIKVK